jgi:hypothetical protein
VSVTSSTGEGVLTAIARGGFAFAHGNAMREMLAPFGSLADWQTFADSWNRLELDTYMADGGRYRRRRHAVYDVSSASITRADHQPHFQTVDYNPLNGGVARWFEPIEPDAGASDTLTTIIAFCRSLFSQSAHQPNGPSARQWRVEVHQFRIEARHGEQGRPTPEGLHRDGVDYVLVLLVDRVNIASGVTTIHALDGTRLGSFTLTTPLDAALVDDTRVAHGVTPVAPIDPHRPAHRDVLVVTFAGLPQSK